MGTCYDWCGSQRYPTERARCVAQSIKFDSWLSWMILRRGQSLVRSVYPSFKSYMQFLGCCCSRGGCVTREGGMCKCFISYGVTNSCMITLIGRAQ